MNASTDSTTTSAGSSENNNVSPASTACTNTTTPSASTGTVTSTSTAILSPAGLAALTRYQSEAPAQKPEALPCVDESTRFHEALKGGAYHFTLKSTQNDMNRLKSCAEGVFGASQIDFLLKDADLDYFVEYYNNHMELYSGLPPHIIASMKIGKAIYLELLKLLSTDLYEQISSSHIKHSIYSLWQALSKVLVPLNINTAMGAHMTLHSGTIYQGSPDKAFGTIESNVNLLTAFPIDPRLLYTWINFPEPYKQIVVDAMVGGKLTYEEVKFRIRQLHTIQQAKGALATTNSSETRVALAHSLPSESTNTSGDSVNVMKAGIQYPQSHNNNNNNNYHGKSSFKPYTNQHQGQQQRRELRYCRLCKEQTDHSVDRCPELGRLIKVANALDDSSTHGSRQRYNGRR